MSMSSRKKGSGGGFQSMAISKPIFKGIMRIGYKVPTPIQRKALPLGLQGKDIVAMARTGSGKTCAFLVPLLDRIQQHGIDYGARGVVLSPTRELAIQTLKFAKSLAKFTDIRFALLVGGDSMDTQFSALATNPDVLIATPGRLMHHLLEVPDFKMNKVEVVVFDEADRLFEMGFAEQLREIVKEMPEQRQTLLYSATLPQTLISFARAGLKSPEVVRLDSETKISDQLKIGFFTVRSVDKYAAFLLVMRDIIPKDQMSIVFVATRHHVELVYNLLKKVGIDAAYVYGTMDQTARHENIDKFRAKTLKIMVVTDVAARGIDIPLLDNVVNLHFPAVPKLFVHRVGRAARAGRSGVALSLVAPDELAHLMDLDLFLGKDLAAGKGVSPYTLDAMATTDVHFGSLPQSRLDAEVETVHQLISNHSDLQAMVKVAGRGYKQYIRTRTEPSHRSIQRGKVVMRFCFLGTCIHPLAANFANSQMNSAAEGSQTKMDRQTQQEQESLVAEKEDYLSQLRTFRPKETILELSTHRSGTEGSRGDMLSTMQNKRALHQGVIMRRQQQELMIDSDSTITESHEAASEPPKMQMNVAPAGTAVTAVTAAAAVEPVQKRRMSKAERNRMKKAKARGETVEQECEASVIDKQESKPKNSSSKSEHYVSYDLTAQQDFEAQRYADTDSKTASAMAQNMLEGALLDVIPDEAVAMIDKKRVQRWDKKKRKFVQTTIGAMRRGEQKTRTESGAVITSAKRKAEQQGKAYAKWSFKHKKNIGGGVEVVLGDGDTAPGDADSIMVDGNKMDFRRGAKRARHNAQLMGIVHQNVTSATVNADVEDELKSEDVIRKDTASKKLAADRNKGKKHMKNVGRKSGGKKKKGKGNFGTKGKVKMIIRRK